MLFPDLSNTADFGVPGPSIPAVLSVTGGYSWAECERIAMDDILWAVSRSFRLERGDLTSPRRHRVIAWPRQAVFWIAREYTPLTFATIGRILKRDHTTVMKGADRCEELMRADPIYRGTVMRAVELAEARRDKKVMEAV